ncbi:hypothetical protein COEREDRAFT_81166 [Coemansia reversa NRRL 1564]|uniref:AD domain-containing protein n=1 Tax=Coemansia reversa (strain ATCC 12441 / NRRL 1564) TaxID=763665 RepID=A0A2G5BCQ5_COERN|nr:hypothetical protein COEREDRAFT_81166 [Coemansia reversa NRRL 1564]|eukprot:PIA16497.1 hypothetical protein COEREDRAFT_81166 [Coemansia reversa NRRL 1564]
MDYRAAARRQLSDNRTLSFTPKNNSQDVVTPPNAATTSNTESPRLKANSGDRSLNSTSLNTKKTNTGAQLSYAATAAKKNAGGENELSLRKGTGRQTHASPPLVSLTLLVNTLLSIDLVDGRTIEGLLFTYDVYSGVVALVSVCGDDESSERKQVHLVKAVNITDVRVLSKEENSQNNIPEINVVPVAAIEARKQRALAQERERASRIGVGVSDRAQSIFEALSKTMPCRWEKDRIVVLDEVIIESPYTVDSCCEVTSAAFSLSRVKKVLQGELNRLEPAASTNSDPATL